MSLNVSNTVLIHISIAASALQSRVKVREWMLQVKNGSCAATLGGPIGEIDISVPIPTPFPPTLQIWKVVQ